MSVIKLRNVEKFKDRFGKIRYYYRVGKGKRTAIEGEPGTEKFHESYKTAATGYDKTKASDAGTFNALANAYFSSMGYKALKQVSKDTIYRAIQRFLNAHGHRMVSQMTRLHVNQLVAQKIATPSAANELLKIIRILIRFAIGIDWVKFDPTIGVKKFKVGTWHTWDEAEIAQFEKRWPVGSWERTAFALHLYTGQRRADICKMLWTDIVNGKAWVSQQKSENHAEPVRLLIPLHKNLRQILAARPANGGIIISTEQGEKFNVEAYGNKMAAAIGLSGVGDRCVLHGVRKAAARRLADVGCTSHQIMAITGHKTLAEVERYTRAAGQKKLAETAIESLGEFEIDQ